MGGSACVDATGRRVGSSTAPNKKETARPLFRGTAPASSSASRDLLALSEPEGRVEVRVEGRSYQLTRLLTPNRSAPT